MKNYAYRLLLISIIVADMPLLFNCGGGSAMQPTATSSSVASAQLSVAPQSTAIATGQTVQFSLSGGSGSATWSVSGGATSSEGAVSSTGLYTASSAPGVYTVTASDPGETASATVTVVAPGTVSSTNHPLVANYAITPPRQGNVSVQFGPDTSYGLSTSQQSSPVSGGTVNMLVAGMRASTTYHMRATIAFPDGAQYVDADQVFTTGNPPAGRVPQVTVTRPSGLPSNGGVELLSLTPGSANQLLAGVTDLNGNLIWYYDFVPSGNPDSLLPFPFKPLPNGHMLINAGSVEAPGPQQLTQEVDLAGNVVRQFSATDLNNWLTQAGHNFGFVSVHHDIAILPNGHWILLIQIRQNFTDLPGYPGQQTVIGDGLVDLDPNWNIVWTWSTFDHLDVNRHPFGLGDWTHGNAVIYSPTDGNLILSMRNQSWVIKIDYKNGQGAGDILWRLGPGGDFTLQGGVDPTDWNYAQHYPVLLSTDLGGNFRLILFNDGNNRVIDSSGDVCTAAGPFPVAPNPCYSSVPIFGINENAKTATLLLNDKLPGFSFFGGSADQLANGDIEYDICSYAPLPPATPPPMAALVQEVTDQANPQVVWQMEIVDQYAYRAYRIPSLYPGVQW